MKTIIRRIACVLSVVLMLTGTNLGTLADTLKLPVALKVIDVEAFCGDTSLDEVTLQEGTTEIRARAFAGSSLTAIDFPSSLSHIAEDAFEGCGAFRAKCAPGSYAERWCGDHGVKDGDCYEISVPDPNAVLGRTRMTLHVGETHSLRAGPKYVIDQLTFESSDATVVTVNALGEVTGVSLGVANVIALAPDGVSSACEITIEAHTVVTLEGRPATCTEDGLSEGSYCSVCGAVLAEQEVLPAAGHVWNSGRVTQEATVAADGIYTYTCRVCGATDAKVIPAIGSIDPAANVSAQLHVGETLRQSVANAASYLSTDEAVATVDQSGLVTPVAPGYASIVACDSDGYTLSNALVWVKGTPVINESSVELTIGDDYTLTGTLDGLVFTSSNTSVVAVGRHNGYITALAEGTATITAQATDGSYSTSVNVTVGPQYRYRVSVGIYIGDSESLMIEGLADRWTYTSTDTGIATVDGNGVVTGVAEGSTTIEAVRNDNADISFVSTVTVTKDQTEDFEYSTYWANGYTTRRVSITGYNGNGGDVVIPSVLGGYSVDEIGAQAFAHCSSLTSVTIPDGVSVIGAYAFWECSNLITVTIPESVTSIHQNAFFCCDNITSFSILDNVTSIGNNVFVDCYYAKKYANIGSDGAKALSKAGYTFTVPGTKYELRYLYSNDEISGMEFYIADRDILCCTIPDGVTSIYDYAFLSCTNLTSITIPDGVTSIGSSAFGFCSSLTSITIPDSVTTIGERTFQECTNLKSITIPDSVTSIGFLAFNECSSLTSIIIPDSVTTIEAYAFGNCSSLTSITIPDSVTTIGKEAFRNCSSLISITIPNSVTSFDITEYAFENCSSLTSFEIPYCVTSIGNYAFSNCSNLKSITIPNSVTAIGGSAFYNCSSLRDIVIPDGVTAIGYRAFEDCSSLENVTIPESMLTISQKAFYNCSSLISITIPGGVSRIDEYAFYNCSNLKTVTILDGETSIEIGQYAFQKCSSLSSITFADDSTVTKVGFGAIDSDHVILFANMDSECAKSLGKLLLPFRVPGTNYSLRYRYYYWSGEYEFSGLELVSADSDVLNFTVPDCVKTICNSAFENCTNLASITVPDSVTSIESTAFDGCAKAMYYVTEGSYAHQWCQSNDKPFYLSGSNADAASTVTLDSGETRNVLEEGYQAPDILLGTGMTYDLNSHFGKPTDPVYKCSNPDVAEVYDSIQKYWLYYTAEDGTVCSKQRANSGGTLRANQAGSATITATQEFAHKSSSILLILPGETYPPLTTASATCTIKVAGFDKPSYSMRVEDGTMTVPVSDPCGIAGDPGSWTWRSSNEAFAEVNSNGTVTAVGAGQCTITVQFNDALQASYVLNIGAAQSWISLPEAEWDFTMGFESTFALHPRAMWPEVESPGDYRFASSNQSVVTCDAKGVLTSYKKEGTSTITISKDGVKMCTVTCTVKDLTVEQAKADIDLKMAEYENKYAALIKEVANSVLEDVKNEKGLAADAVLRLSLQSSTRILTRRDQLYNDMAVALIDYIEKECRLSRADYNKLSNSFDILNPYDNLVTQVARSLTIGKEASIAVESDGAMYIAELSITSTGKVNGIAGQYSIHIGSLRSGNGPVYSGMATITSETALLELMSTLRAFSDEQTKAACEKVLDQTFKGMKLDAFWEAAKGMYKTYEKVKRFDNKYVKSKEGIFYNIGKLMVAKKVYDELEKLYKDADKTLKNDFFDKLKKLFTGAQSDETYTKFVTGQRTAMKLFQEGLLDSFKNSNIYKFTNMDEVVDGMAESLFNCDVEHLSLLSMYW